MGRHREWNVCGGSGRIGSQPASGHGSRVSEGTDRFTDMSLDQSGNLWATSDAGLFVHDASGWHAIDPGKSGARPDLITVDWNGDIWVAGPSHDLMRLRVRDYKVTQAEHIGRPPLMSEGIVSLVVDHRGWLWVGEDAGVTVYDGHRWRSFTQDDGLIWNDTDSFALTEDRDGSMWIGTSGGLSHLIAPQDALAGSPPPPAISQVMLGTSRLRTAVRSSGVQTSYQFRWRCSPSKIPRTSAIRYRLDWRARFGWEETREMTLHYAIWIRAITAFEVQAMNAAGSAVSPVASFAFKITPLWWQRQVDQVGVRPCRAGARRLDVATPRGQLMRQKRQLEVAVQGRTQDLEREKTELVRTREQMRHFAEHDGLTGLWNHRIIVERLRGEVDRSQREGTPLSIILVDLDYFKRVNDAMGHMAGDLTLRETGSIFQRAVRSYDWVGRYGGEEFLLILPGSDFEAARNRAEHLRATLEAAFLGEGDKTFTVTASFGVAAGFPTNYEEMIKIADAALYRAKNAGRNCVMATEIKPTVVSISAERSRPLRYREMNDRSRSGSVFAID